jgi:glycosyltransferase involved in cell wall biosynthesis
MLRKNWELINMDLKNLITIVIPCKNEKDVILKTLDLLNYQRNVTGVNVIVCDSSNDSVTYESLINRLTHNKDLFDLIIIDGGLPGIARNKGFKIVKTPYVLFMDSDVFLLDAKILTQSIKKIHKNNLDLVTTKFRTDNGEYNYIYKSFDVIQSLSKWITPFCLGGFMLIRSETFKLIGGFDEDVKVAEDYILSKQIKSNKFSRLNNIIYTLPRRFKNKGVMYMIKLMITSLFNRNNKSYFKNDKGYWE